MMKLTAIRALQARVNRTPILCHPKLVILTIAALVSGCGGGGGGSSTTANSPPVAQSGNLTTNEDTTGTGTLVATDPDLQTLTYSIVANGGKGTATITNANTGAYNYVPNANENGSDSFTFKTNDSLADSNTATIFVNITPVNDPPTAIPGCGTIRQSQQLSGTLSATDPETSSNFLTYTLEGSPTTPNGGTVNILSNGAFTYDPKSSGGGGRGLDTFTFTVTDLDGGEDTATQTVVVDQTIMPLGDSITSGRENAAGPADTLRVGYRKFLHDTLLASGYTFDFVGSLLHGSALFSEHQHEGHGGFTAAQIATDVRAWLNANPADIVLLHAGTNDLNPSNDTDIASILDEIKGWGNTAGNPVTVILALIVDQDPFPPTSEVAAFNANVLALANARIAAGDNIIVANHHDALSYPGDIPDGTHPNASGYAKMATVWFDKLTVTALLDKCP